MDVVSFTFAPATSHEVDGRLVTVPAHFEMLVVRLDDKPVDRDPPELLVARLSRDIGIATIPGDPPELWFLDGLLPADGLAGWQVARMLIGEELWAVAERLVQQGRPAENVEVAVEAAPWRSTTHIQDLLEAERLGRIRSLPPTAEEKEEFWHIVNSQAVRQVIARMFDDERDDAPGSTR